MIMESLCTRWCKTLSFALLLIANIQGTGADTITSQFEPPPGTLSWEDALPGKHYMADELIVAFKPSLFDIPTDNPGSLEPWQVDQLHQQLKARANALAKAFGFEVRDTSPIVPVALMRLPETISPVEAMTQVENDPRVMFAEPNGIANATQTTPTDPCWTDSSDACFNAQLGHITDVGGQRGWDAITIDFQVRIAVIDSGYRFDHPDAWYDVSTTDDRDFVMPGFTSTPLCTTGAPSTRDWDLVGYDDDASELMAMTPPPFAPFCLTADPAGSHGTKVAGTIASDWNNDEGGVGVIGRVHLMNPANRSTIIPIQALDVEGTGTAYDTSQGIIYAAGLLASNGSGGVVSMQAADIANMSFRSLMPSNYQNSVVQIADAIGLLMVAAVGNDAAPIPTFPAWYPQVISVSAIDTTEALASFSNWGKVELTAPGVNVYTTSYDYSGCVQQPPLPCDSASGGAPGYFPATGTSLAAPIVSGIAALYKAHNDWVNNVILRNMLLNNAADWGTPGVDIQFGEGLVQAAPGRGAGLVTDVGPMQAYVVNRDTGEIREDLTIGGAFQFPNLPSGRYYLLAATDEDGDGIYGETAEAVGAGGGGGALQNARTRFWPGGTLAGTINFTPEWPGVEAVGNDVWTGASTTFVGLYAETAHSSAGDIDWFRFKVPFSGTYRLWTEGRNTVECRTVYNEMDPLMSLYEDPTSAAINVDSDSGTGTCAELNVWLDTSKWYYVTIESEDAAQDIGDATILHIDGPV